jgi:hypothetical protein
VRKFAIPFLAQKQGVRGQEDHLLALARKKGEFTEGTWSIKKLTDKDLHIVDYQGSAGRNNQEFERIQ